MSALNSTLRSTVLLVDDDSAILLVLGEILDNLGVSTLTATTGEDAIEIAARHRSAIDAVVLDLRLPGMGGEQVGVALRQSMPECPIIISSGYGAEDVGVEDGYRFLPKPYDAEDIARALDEVGVVIKRRGG